MPKIVFEYGKVWTIDELRSNSIALDGAVQGPSSDPLRRVFSFDHHGGCLRLVTLPTCQQVETALHLGLVVDEETTILVNDWDADTVVSLWLLEKAAKGEFEKVIYDYRVLGLIERVGRTDAHGPVFTPHIMHTALGPKWGDKTPQTLEMGLGFMKVLEDWYVTNRTPPEALPRAGVGYGLKAKGGWVPVTTPDGFGPLYSQGFLAAALFTAANEDTLTWVVGKRSDLVPLPLGPADASKDRSGDYTQTILGALAKAEAAKGVASRDNWGGGSSIGGSPRLPGGVGSRLSEEEVLTILNRFTIKEGA